MTKPETARHPTTNWKSYNDALKQRGSLLIGLDKDMGGSPPRLDFPAVQRWFPPLQQT